MRPSPPLAFLFPAVSLLLVALLLPREANAAPVPVARLVPVAATSPQGTHPGSTLVKPGEAVELWLDESYWALDDGDDAAEPAALTAWVDWGDGASSGPSNATRFTHAYDRAGDYTVVARVSDGTGDRTEGGWAVPAVLLPLTVADSSACFTYRVWLERAADTEYLPGAAHEPAGGRSLALAADPGAAYVLFLQVTGGRASGNADADLSRMFWRLGDHPAVSVSNDTAAVGAGAARFDRTNGWWYTSLETGPDRGTLVLRSEGQGTAVLGCTVEPGRHAVTLRHAASFAALEAGAGATTVATAAAAGFRPASLRVTQHACVPGLSYLLLGVGAEHAGMGLGGLVLRSETAFRDGAGALVDFGSAACDALGLAGAECLALEVADLSAAADRLLVLTTAGLLRSAPLSAAGTNVSLEGVRTGLASVDQGTWRGAGGSAQFDRGDLCPAVTQGEPADLVALRVVEDGTAPDTVSLLVSLDSAHGEWYAVAPDGADPGTARSAAWDEVSGALDVLADAAGEPTVFRCVQAASPANASACAWEAAATFPAGTELDALRSLPGGLGALVHGPSSVWSSAGGAARYTLVDVLDTSAAGVPASVATGASAFVALTDAGLVLWGRAGAVATAELTGRVGTATNAVRAGADGTTEAERLSAVLFDALAEPYLVQVTSAVASTLPAAADGADGDELPGHPALDSSLAYPRLKCERLSSERALEPHVFAGRATYGALDAVEALVPLETSAEVVFTTAPYGAAVDAPASAALGVQHIGAELVTASGEPLGTVGAVDASASGVPWSSAAWSLPTAAHPLAAVTAAAGCAADECPAAGYGIEVELTGAAQPGAEGVARLVGTPDGSSAAAEGWTAADVGRTVLLPGGGSYWVRARTSASEAAVVAFSVAAPHTNLTQAAGVGGWVLVDLRTHRNLAAAGGQTLSAMAGATNRSVTLTLDRAGSAAFPDTSLPLVVVLGAGGAGGVGVMVSRGAGGQTAEFAAVAGRAFADGTTYAAGEWTLHEARAGAAWTESGLATSAARGWTAPLAPCPYKTFSDNTAATAGGSPVQYLDMGDRTTLVSALVPADGAEAEAPRILASCSNAGSVMVALGADASAAATNPGMYGASEEAMALAARDGSVAVVADVTQALATRRAGVSTVSTVSFAPERSGLRCGGGGAVQVYRVVVGCPVGKHMRLRSSASHDEVALPYNYRPPSRRGRDVPLTANVYNAHPGRPRPNDFFPESELSGEFKAQCTAAAAAGGVSAGDENPCGCTAEQRLSQRVEDSDCVRSARRALFLRAFVPDLEVVVQGGAVASPSTKLLLTELNGRTDWCLNTTSSCPKAGDGESRRVLDTARNAAIMWTGVDLYHFRAEAIDESLTHCALEAEFTVYVVTPTLPRVMEFVVLSSTAYVIGFALLAGYMAHVYQNGTGVRKILVN